MFVRAEDEVLRLRQKMGLGDELVIVTVGRMSVEKGHANLLTRDRPSEGQARTS